MLCSKGEMRSHLELSLQMDLPQLILRWDSKPELSRWDQWNHKSPYNVGEWGETESVM